MEEHEGHWSTARVEAFSDGVFAIAITLLVLEIGIDPDQFGDLWHAIVQEWPSYLAYVTSFLTVGGVWLAHHRLFMRLRFVDPTLMRLNILLLMVASFLPFPTGLLAEAFHASRDAERAAVVVYGGTAILIEALIGAARRYADSHPELLHGPPPPAREALERHGLSVAAYSAAVLAGILIVPRLAAIAFLVVAVRAALLPGGEGRLTLRGPP
jgi:TMEM175 potassium channel family protein